MKHNNSGDEFGKHVSKLLQLLKKMLKSQNVDNDDLKKIFDDAVKDGTINLNMFLTFMPISPDDFDEFTAEFDEFMEEDLVQENDKGELIFELDSNDQDFLKQHGIKF